MPRFDGTGPWGQGPFTGWGLGPCKTGRRRSSKSGFSSWGSPRWGRPTSDYGSFGAGGPGYGANPQDEAQALRDEQAYLQGELEAVQKRLAELETS